VSIKECLDLLKIRNSETMRYTRKRNNEKCMPLFETNRRFAI
jgi:hypothetical protein